MPTLVWDSRPAKPVIDLSHEEFSRVWELFDNADDAWAHRGLQSHLEQAMNQDRGKLSSLNSFTLFSVIWSFSKPPGMRDWKVIWAQIRDVRKFRDVLEQLVSRYNTYLKEYGGKGNKNTCTVQMDNQKLREEKETKSSDKSSTGHAKSVHPSVQIPDISNEYGDQRALAIDEVPHSLSADPDLQLPDSKVPWGQTEGTPIFQLDDIYQTSLPVDDSRMRDAGYQQPSNPLPFPGNAYMDFSSLDPLLCSPPNDIPQWDSYPSQNYLKRNTFSSLPHMNPYLDASAASNLTMDSDAPFFLPRNNDGREDRNDFLGGSLSGQEYGSVQYPVESTPSGRWIYSLDMANSNSGFVLEPGLYDNHFCLVSPSTRSAVLQVLFSLLFAVES
ncbi:hypothetical protein C8R42DRAFT_771691 [Lentinula raphanica]|nr:hypothetical protein C8R42DRAFT_771691 [Lentinula raphanica]